MNKLSLGVDIGGTNITVGLVTKEGVVVKKKEFSTDVKRSYKCVIGDVIDNLSSIMDGYGSSIKGIGVGCAGVIDQGKGIIRFSPNLFWKNVPIVDMLKKKFNIPVCLDNDANVACWGAYKLYRLPVYSTAICITLGTGVGGGIVINGKLYLGATGGAGEIGHMPLDPLGPECNCGSRGCLERYVGAGYIVEKCIKRISEGQKTIIKDLVCNDLKNISPKTVYEAALKKDNFALKIWEELGSDLGVVLAGVVNCLNPDVIFFSGGVAKSSKFFFPSMKKTIHERAFKTLVNRVRFIRVKNSGHLGVIGAALLCFSD